MQRKGEGHLLEAERLLDLLGFASDPARATLLETARVEALVAQAAFAGVTSEMLANNTIVVGRS